MSLSIGIVGLPNVGKSTLFNALTKNQVLAANYPFATIDPNVGIVNVPDEKLDKLAKISNSKQLVPATVKFIDIAGLVKGAATGAGLGNKFLSHIREVGAIAQVVRAFEDKDITHVEDRVHPIDDIEIINNELCLADIKTVENKIEKLEIEQKSNPKILDEINLYKKIKETLDNARPISQSLEQIPDSMSELNLLTAKQFIYVFNVDEDNLGNMDKRKKLEEIITTNPSIVLSAKLESELIDLDEKEKQQLLDEFNQKESGLMRLVKIGYKSLGLTTFYTSGEKETRAWVIKEGYSAPQAAGVIHTDFEKGFIKAEVVNADDFIGYGGWSGAKSKGKVRLEGKDYIMREDDVALFRFNN